MAKKKDERIIGEPSMAKYRSRTNAEQIKIDGKTLDQLLAEKPKKKQAAKPENEEQLMASPPSGTSTSVKKKRIGFGPGVGHLRGRDNEIVTKKGTLDGKTGRSGFGGGVGRLESFGK